MWHCLALHSSSHIHSFFCVAVLLHGLNIFALVVHLPALCSSPPMRFFSPGIQPTHRIPQSWWCASSLAISKASPPSLHCHIYNKQKSSQDNKQPHWTRQQTLYWEIFQGSHICVKNTCFCSVPDNSHGPGLGTFPLVGVFFHGEFTFTPSVMMICIITCHLKSISCFTSLPHILWAKKFTRHHKAPLHQARNLVPGNMPALLNWHHKHFFLFSPPHSPGPGIFPLVGLFFHRGFKFSPSVMTICIITCHLKSISCLTSLPHSLLAKGFTRHHKAPLFQATHTVPGTMPVPPNWCHKHSFPYTSHGPGLCTSSPVGAFFWWGFQLTHPLHVAHWCLSFNRLF